jgi:hypothetical protein
MKKKTKYDKPVKADMGFDEMMQRLSNVDKSTVEKNIRKKKTNNKK